MAKTGAKKKSAGKQTSLTGNGLFPTLAKTSVAIGLYCLVPGPFWVGCPDVDKDKKYKCIVTEFIAVHSFHGGRKGSGFKCKEMGESGEGSLEPGVASGDEFVIGYPMPFLEYFYAANPDKLPVAIRPKEIMAEADETDGGASAEGSGEQNDSSAGTSTKTDATRKPPVFDHLSPVTSCLNVSGPKRGQYTNKYKCAIPCAGGIPCGASITLYGNGKSETSSNAFNHIRDRAEKGCPFHKAVIDKLDESNSKRVKNADGDFVPVHSFEEAFTHHVEYVWCRAAGIFGANTGKKPEFRSYIRGALPSALCPLPSA